MRRTRYLAALAGAAAPGSHAPLLRPPRRLFGHEPPSPERPAAPDGLDVRSAQPAPSARDGEPPRSRPPASGFDGSALGLIAPTSTSRDARSEATARRDDEPTGVQRALRSTPPGGQRPADGPHDANEAPTPGVQHTNVTPTSQHAAVASAARGSIRGERAADGPRSRPVQHANTTRGDTQTTSSDEDARTRTLKTGTGPSSRRQTPTSPAEVHPPRSPRSVAATDVATGARSAPARPHGPTRRAPSLHIGTIEVRVTAPQTQPAAPTAPPQPAPGPRPSASANLPLAMGGPPRWFGLAQR